MPAAEPSTQRRAEAGLTVQANNDATPLQSYLSAQQNDWGW